MIARLRARLHGLRRGHQTYGGVFINGPTAGRSAYRCHACGWEVVA